MRGQKGPVILIEEGPTELRKGVDDAFTIGLSNIVSAMGKASDLAPYPNDELFGMLHFRLHTADQAERRLRWIGGRLYNHWSGERADYIPLSGAHLAQVLDFSDIELPNVVVASGKYWLRKDFARQAYGRLKVVLD